jgi:hypothetical protein
MRRFACMLVLCAATARAEAIPLYAPWHRPSVAVTIGGGQYSMLLDTGSHEHVWSLRAARAAHAELVPAGQALDVDMRAHENFAAMLTASIVDGAWPPAPLMASQWADDFADWSPGGPRSDGVLSPQRLAAPGHAIVLDLKSGRLDDAPWPRALERLAARGRLLADVTAQNGVFYVAARVGGHEVRLVVDTGAPTSLLYQPRGDGLPGGLVRSAVHPRRIEVGAVRASIVVEEREPVAEPGFDGLLGMDVLRDCVLLMDARRLVARCAEVADMGAPIGDASLLPKRVQVGVAGPWLEERVAGGYHYDGEGFSADLARDGSVVFQRHASGLTMRTERQERAWFMDATAILREELSRADSLRTSFERLPRHLASIWHARRWSPAERREILFRIWDEAAEPDDPELGDAGAHARKMVERFVRAELPEGSPLQFTDEELRRLNRRRARGPRFDPYHPARDRGVALPE